MWHKTECISLQFHHMLKYVYKKWNTSHDFNTVMTVWQCMRLNSFCRASYMRLISGAEIHATHCVHQTSCERSPSGNLQHLHCVSEDNIHQCSTKIICQHYSIYIRLHSPRHLLLALPPKLTQMRRQEIVISPRLCMKIKLGIAFVLDSLPCKQRSCFLIFM